MRAPSAQPPSHLSATGDHSAAHRAQQVGGGGGGGPGVEAARDPGRPHLRLRPHPRVVVHVGVCHQAHKAPRLLVRADQVVGGPLDRLARPGRLAGGRVAGAKVQGSGGQEERGLGGGQAVLDVVARVVPAASR